nr:DNA polymerase IV [Actinomycetota bacterium]
TAERLEGMGIRTIADLRARPEAALREAFGERHGRDLARRAHFEHDGEVAPVRETKSQSSETTFDVDVADRAEQVGVLDRLAADLCERLARRELRGRTVGIKVRLDDWTTVTRARTLDHATDELETVRTIARELLHAYDPPRPVRLLGVRVAGFEGSALDEEGAPQLRLSV